MWYKIICNNPYLLDLRILEKLQRRYSALSLADRQYIREIFEQSDIFRYIDNLNLRAKILDTSLNYSIIIPSLKIFFENTKYIKTITDIVKRILSSNSKGTIHQTMFRYYILSENRIFSIQYSENNYIERQTPNLYSFWSVYRQIYLFAIYNFCGLTDCYPLGFICISRAKYSDIFEVWERFRNLISRVGFVFSGSTGARPDRTEFIAIRVFVSCLRSPEFFICNKSKLNKLTVYIVSVFFSMDPRSIPELDSIQI